MVLEKTHFDAVIFDLDGVVTRTARVHAAAWKQLFDEYREERLRRKLPAYSPFDSDHDYRLYVDGKSRYDGIESFLRARGLELPRGHEDDPPGTETVCGLANRKNVLFQERLESAGVQVYESTVCLVRALRQRGFRVAVISASRNCSAVLQAAHLQDLFEVQVDGIVSADLNLQSKPEPDIFLEAAKRLGASPARTVVVEDALAGVEAGRRGGFGLVIGVDRTGKPERLREHAHLVVADLAEVTAGDPEHAPARSTAELPSALERVDKIVTSRTRPLAIFLDYDGTLTPIVARPEDAVLDDKMREVVRQLARSCRVAVVSGRDLADVRQRVGLDNVVYAGSHGFDISGPNGLRKENPDAQSCLSSLDEAEALLRNQVADIPGVQVERKKYSVATHFRNVPPDRADAVEPVVDAVAARFGNLRKGYGKKVFELQPNIEWDKGRAVMWLLQALELEGTGVLPLYFGDDFTDEDAFLALRDRGVGIIVRDEPRPTAARYALDNTVEVGSFLALLVGQCPERL